MKILFSEGHHFNFQIIVPLFYRRFYRIFIIHSFLQDFSPTKFESNILSHPFCSPPPPPTEISKFGPPFFWFAPLICDIQYPTQKRAHSVGNHMPSFGGQLAKEWEIGSRSGFPPLNYHKVLKPHFLFTLIKFEILISPPFITCFLLTPLKLLSLCLWWNIFLVTQKLVRLYNFVIWEMSINGTLGIENIFMPLFHE